MPAGFDRCQKRGGRVRTVTGPDKDFQLERGEYRHVCFLDGEAHWGYKKKNQKAEAMRRLEQKRGRGK